MVTGDDLLRELPWLYRDHERIGALLSEIDDTLQREAMSFVVHRLLEDLRVLCRLHFARQRRALARAGVDLEPLCESDAFMERLGAWQREICTSRCVDHDALRRFLRGWWTLHREACETALQQAVSQASGGTRWDMKHGDAVYLAGVAAGIPLDPQTSGGFVV